MELPPLIRKAELRSPGACGLKVATSKAWLASGSIFTSGGDGSRSAHAGSCVARMNTAAFIVACGTDTTDRVTGQSGASAKRKKAVKAARVNQWVVWLKTGAAAGS